MSATVLSAPFLEHIKPYFTDAERYAAFKAACCKPLRRSIRCNGLKVAPHHTQAIFAERDIPLHTIPWANHGHWLGKTPDSQLGNWVEHLSGGFYIQEASSMLPAYALTTLLDDKPRHQLKLLDMAAAPGSKTTQLADWLGNQGLLVANELSSSRLKVLAANLQRSGVRNAAITHFDARVFGHYQHQQFDGILLDAPCSGEGTVRKDPTALKHWSLSAVKELSALQKELIVSAFNALKPGGVLIYSTCTLNEYENQQVCQHLLTQEGEAVAAVPLTQLFPQAAQSATAEGYLHVWPHIYDSEGFFVAAFRKTGASSPDPELMRVHRPKVFPYQPATRKQVQALEHALHQQFGFTTPEHFTWYQREQSFWLFPIAFEPFIKTMKFDRIGIKVADAVKSGFRFHHELATCLHDCCEHPPVSLTAEQARDYLMGRDIDLTVASKGERIVSYNEHVLGLAKPVNNRLKNRLPRELVRDHNITV